MYVFKSCVFRQWNKKKLSFYTSKKSISRNGYVRKIKTELLVNFILFYYPEGGDVAERNSKSMQFFVLGNC
jgi:hypothetical protein